MQDTSMEGGMDVLDLSVGHTNPIANYLRTVEQCGGMVREFIREAILNQETSSCTAPVDHNMQVFTLAMESRLERTIPVPGFKLIG